MARVLSHPLASEIESLASMPAFVEAALARVPPSGWSRKPSPDAFSLVEQACHLRDVEREAYLERVRRVLAEDAPDLAGFDGAAVAARRRYPEQDGKLAAQQFAAARRELVALLGATTPRDLARGARFMGEAVTLARLVEMMLDHDREHRAEIAALCAALEEQ
jgi:hypothetical protein